jgi:general secretion pathway protein K
MGAGEAELVAAATADFIDSDTLASSNGGETGAPNRLMLDESELRAVSGMNDARYRRLRPWICALPTADLSPINVNTLAPEQNLLVAMLGDATLVPESARAAIVQRPSGGFGSVMNFWNSPAMRGIQVSSEASGQVRVRSSFFTLTATVERGRTQLGRSALLDARTTPVRLVRRGAAS